MKTVVVTTPPEADQLPLLRARLRAWLEANEVSVELAEAVVLAAHEAAANGIVHAGSRDTFEIRGSINDHGVTIEVSDAGRWKEPSGRDDEGGRGLPLMRGFVDEVDILPTRNGTTVHLYQPLHPGLD